jgi:hypothetical protein
MFHSSRPTLPFTSLVLCFSVCIAAVPLLVIGVLLSTTAPCIYDDISFAISFMARACLILILPFAYLYAEAGSSHELEMESTGSVEVVDSESSASENRSLNNRDASRSISSNFFRSQKSLDTLSTGIPSEGSVSTKSFAIFSSLHSSPLRGGPNVKSRILETLKTLSPMYGLFVLLVVIVPGPSIIQVTQVIVLFLFLISFIPHGLALHLESISSWMVTKAQAKQVINLLENVQLQLMALQSQKDIMNRMESSDIALKIFETTAGTNANAGQNRYRIVRAFNFRIAEGFNFIF